MEVKDTLKNLLKYIKKNLDVTFIIFIALSVLILAWFLEWYLGKWNVSRGIGTIISIIVFIIGLIGEIKNIISNMDYKEKYLNFSEQVSQTMSELLGHFREVKGKVEISLKDFLEDYEDLYKKFRSPIKIVIDNEFINVLNQLSQSSSSGQPILDLQGTPSGMIWVIGRSNLSVYAKIATYFDRAAYNNLKGYIYSTNTILPSEFNDDPNNLIRDHILEANKLATLQTDSGKPRLLRLQLLRSEKPTNFKTPINTQGEFIQDLKRIQDYSNCNFKEYWNNNCFALNVDHSDIKNDIIKYFEVSNFEESSLFLGEYIIYSDSVVVKWDSSCRVLYLIFGEDIVKVYKNIFDLFLNNWKDKKCNITKELTDNINNTVNSCGSVSY